MGHATMAMGRFVQPDSRVPNIFNPQDLNRYTYGRNNPLTYIDRDGHIPIIFGIMLIGAGSFALVNEVNQINAYAQSHHMGFWEAAFSPRLDLDQASMVDSAVRGGMIAGVAAESVPVALAAGGLTAQQAAIATNNPQMWQTGTKLLDTSSAVNAALLGSRPATQAVPAQGTTDTQSATTAPAPPAHTRQDPRPPGWDETWTMDYGTRAGETDLRYRDPSGGEWRWHGPDPHHEEGHRDYNPWNAWNDEWQNRDENGAPIP